MAITGVTEDEYRHFVAHGGVLRFEIGASDIDPSIAFEKSSLIQPYLTSGFELRPSPIIEMPANSAALFLYGGSWERVVAHAYLCGGRIVYTQLPSGRYEAKVEAPAR